MATNVVITTDRPVGLKGTAKLKQLERAIAICIGTAMDDAMITVEIKKKSKERKR